MKQFKASFRKFLRGTDFGLIIICLIASVYGILLVTSATLHNNPEGVFLSSAAKTMIVSTIIGILLATIVSLFNPETIAKLWPIIAIVGVGLMVYTRFFGVAPEGREDAVSWIMIGSTVFQSSELLKIGFIVTFSVHINKVRTHINRIPHLIGLVAHAFIAFFLVSWCGDDGSALVFILIFISMTFFAGLKWYYYAIGAAAAVCGFSVAWFTNIISGYQRRRILAIFNPEEYAMTEAYQQTRAIQAMGSGKLLGKGLFKGEYTQSGYVPVAHNDMILSVAGEELGLFGTIAVVILIVAICMKILSVAGKAQKNVGYYMCCGVAAMIAGQSMINIGMCLRLLPVIGITLPFFSAGGSSTLCLYLGIGIVMSAYRYAKQRRTSLMF
ncbi:MAG: FtsW/RodA/SpoVE family cell cycle protein [Clostridia bacterium]|nr:FtsW/RodA/SpoVE family cell cycle protein [Clostridia bacterium]